MKNFALKHPFIASLLIFLTIFIGGTVAGIILFFVLFAGESDVHGTNIVIPIIFFLVSLVLGIIASLTTFITLIEVEEEKTYK